MTVIRSRNGLKYGQVRPRTAELAVLERFGKIPIDISFYPY